MEDSGSKKRRIPQSMPSLEKEKKQRMMAGNVPVQCPRWRAVEVKDDANSGNRHCFNGSEKVTKTWAAQQSVIFDNVDCPDFERMIRTEKLKHRFADVILKAKLLINGKVDVQEKLASRSAIISGFFRQRSSMKTGLKKGNEVVPTEKEKPAIKSGILPQRWLVKTGVKKEVEWKTEIVRTEKEKPAIRSGILPERSSEKTELRKELKRKREAARTKVRGMKQSADLAENLDALKELKRVFGCSPWVMEAFHGARGENPLEKLGLFLKDTYVDVEADPLDREEGEIY